MNREKQIELLEASLALAREKRRPIDGEETLVPVESYSDPARFERELEHVFKTSFNVVGVVAQVAAPGDFFTTELCGSPVLIARGDDGMLRAFLNVCRHRGATVELSSAGNRSRFVCPYHAWTYNNDGSLYRVRHAEGFPSVSVEQHGLVALPCAELAGLVFVCPSPTATPEQLPAPLVSELEAMLGPEPTIYASTSRVWRANWKLIVEGGIESYHFKVAHKDTIAALFGDTNSTWERIGDHLRSVLPKSSILELGDVPRTEWNIREHTHIVYTLHPNAMILMQRSHFDLIVMRPLSVDSTEIQVLTVGATPETADLSPQSQAFFAKNHAFSVRTLDEDFAIAEQVQRGLNSGANTHFRFARFEGALSDWRRWLETLLEP